jgi:hypothetical protein
VTLNKHVELPDGRTIPLVNVTDYVATMVIPAGERMPLFGMWSSPLVSDRRPGAEQSARVAILARVSESLVMPTDGWGWVITAVASSHAETVLELTHNGRDFHYGGPWLRDGFELDNPIVVEATLGLAGMVDRRRCGLGAINVWLKGFLYRQDYNA